MCSNRLEIGTPHCEIQRQILEFFYSWWTSDFQAYDGTRMGKLFYKGPDKDKAKYVLKLSRADLARFVRIISGHNSLMYFRNKVDGEVDPKCRFCGGEDEAFEHLVNECPRFREGRTDKFLDQVISDDHMWSVRALLDFSSLPGINEALEGGNVPSQYESQAESSRESSLTGRESGEDDPNISTNDSSSEADG